MATSSAEEGQTDEALEILRKTRGVMQDLYGTGVVDKYKGNREADQLRTQYNNIFEGIKSQIKVLNEGGAPATPAEQPATAPAETEAEKPVDGDPADVW